MWLIGSQYQCVNFRNAPPQALGREFSLCERSDDSRSLRGAGFFGFCPRNGSLNRRFFVVCNG